MMKKLARLIQGQDVAFDTHQSGDGREVRWRDLHLEKRLHKGGKIRFHFFGDGQPTSSENVSDRILERVVNEVRRELKKNEQVRDKLAETIIEQIQKFRNGTIEITDAEEAARNIADAFNLGEEFVSIVTKRAGKKIDKVATLHPGFRPGTVVEIVQSDKGVFIQKPKESWRQWKLSGGLNGSNQN